MKAIFKNMFGPFFVSVFIYFFVAYFSQVVFAYVASSTSYQIYDDIISFGGLRATSTSYVEESSFASGVSGTSTSTSYSGSLGYLQAADSFISISNSSNVALLPAINVSSGGQSSGSGSVTVTTDDTSGYELYINAGASPAFQSGADSFLDYVTVTPDTPDFTWSVGAGSTGFGFSPEGSDIFSLYKDNGSSCGVGSSDASDHCWNSLGTSLKKIAQSSLANYPSGTVTTVKFMAEVGSTVRKSTGSYTATITLTAIAL